MRLTSEFVQTVRKRIAENPFSDTAVMARELHMPEAYVLMALPISMRMRVHAADIEAMWEGVARMEHVTVTSAPETRNSNDTLVALCPAQETVGFVWLVSLSLGLGDAFEHSIRIFDVAGAPLVSVTLVGPEGSGDEQIFLALKTLYGIIPKPPKRHACKGCGRCTPETCCKGKGHHGHHGEHHHKHNHGPEPHLEPVTASACA